MFFSASASPPVASNPPFGDAPSLWLGLAGFGAEERDAIAGMLTRARDLPQWQVLQGGNADAWLLNGPRCRVRKDGTLDIEPCLPGEQRLRLDLGEVDRPVAFATPVPDEIEPRCTFQVGSAASAQAVLQLFDAWLRMERAQFELGAQVVRLGSALRHGIFHLMHRGTLIGVLDFRQGQAGLAPVLNPAAVQDAEWHKRPEGAGAIPSGFLASSPAQLAWTYVRRSARDMLPPPYRERTIYFRRVPRVPSRLLEDTHLVLLRALSVEPGTLADLARRTGIPETRLDRALACLYYAGAVTTTPSKAPRAHGNLAGDGVRDSSNPVSLLTVQVPLRNPDEFTVPAVLKARSVPKA